MSIDYQMNLGVGYQVEFLELRKKFMTIEGKTTKTEPRYDPKTGKKTKDVVVKVPGAEVWSIEGNRFRDTDRESAMDMFFFAVAKRLECDTDFGDYTSHTDDIPADDDYRYAPEIVYFSVNEIEAKGGFDYGHVGGDEYIELSSIDEHVMAVNRLGENIKEVLGIDPGPAVVFILHREG